MLIGKAALRASSGLPAGQVKLYRFGDRLRISVAAIALPPGEHGLHLHTTGKCGAPGFSDAGSHFNPAGHQHGSANPAGPHLGDMPNLVADASGAGMVTLELDGTAADLEAQLFDGDGTAIVVHANADDYRTDPSGNSGARIACGVLRRP
jgi:Cu-Zn family superoxide dismutase